MRNMGWWIGRGRLLGRRLGLERWDGKLDEYYDSCVLLCMFCAASRGASVLLSVGLALHFEAFFAIYPLYSLYTTASAHMRWSLQ